MSNEPYEIDKESLKFEEVITGGLIGVSTIIVAQLLQLATFDIPLKISLYSFAISIPMLTAYLVIVWSKTDYNSTLTYGLKGLLFIQEAFVL